jgi:hypothetical protein
MPSRFRVRITSCYSRRFGTDQVIDIPYRALPDHKIQVGLAGCARVIKPRSSNAFDANVGYMMTMNPFIPLAEIVANNAKFMQHRCGAHKI